MPGGVWAGQPGITTVCTWWPTSWVPSEKAAQYSSGCVPWGTPIAAVAGLEPRALTDVYSDTAELGLDDQLDVDEMAAARLAEAFAVGDEALRALSTEEVPVLWPEHFDIAISADEINFGVSPGDAGIAVPYAYVGPWTSRTGDFWNESFGAARPIHDLGGVDAVVNFFAQGRALAATET